MSAHNSGLPAWLVDGFASARNFIGNWSNYATRAVGRVFAGVILGAFLAASLLDIPDTLPGTSDRTIDIVVGAVSAGAILFLLRKFGQGRGMFWGLWVWFVSWVWWQSLVLAAYAAWLAAGMDGDPLTDWTDVAVAGVLSAALFVPTNMALKHRLDPDQ